MPSSPIHIADAPFRLSPATSSPPSLSEMLDDLFRLACEAEAYEIHVETFDYDERPTLSVYDNGRGIDGPRTILAFVASECRRTRRQFERAGGMAPCTLAGLHVIVRSGPDETEPGWSATIPAEAWNGKAPITIEPDAGLRGTNVLVAIPTEWRAQLEEAVAAAARDLPVRVYFHARWKNRR